MLAFQNDRVEKPAMGMLGMYEVDAPVGTGLPWGNIDTALVAIVWRVKELLSGSQIHGHWRQHFTVDSLDWNDHHIIAMG